MVTLEGEELVKEVYVSEVCGSYYTGGRPVGKAEILTRKFMCKRDACQSEGDKQGECLDRRRQEALLQQSPA